MRGKNAGDQVVLGFSFASEWLDGWREFFLGQSGSEVQQGQGCFRICSTLTRKLLFHLHNTFFSFISISAQRNRHKTVNLVILTSIGKRLISTTYPV